MSLLYGTNLCVSPCGFNEVDFPFHNGFLNTHKSEQLVTNVSFPEFSTGLMSSTQAKPFSYDSDLNTTNAESVRGSPTSSSPTINSHMPSSSTDHNNTSPSDEATSGNDRVYREITSIDQIEIMPDIPQTNQEQNVNTQIDQLQLHPMITRSKSGIHKSKVPYIGTASVSANSITTAKSQDTAALSQ